MRHVRLLYTFTYRCKEAPDIELMDGTKSIILNAVGTADDVNGSLKAFLDYVAGKMSEDNYVRRVDMAVELAKMDAALRRDYLVRRQNELVARNRNLEEGRAEGKNELATAIHMLKDNATQEDLLKAGISQDTIDLALTCL